MTKNTPGSRQSTQPSPPWPQTAPPRPSRRARPADLIALTAPDGTEWLSLIRHGSWTQVFPPEIAALNAPSLNVSMQIRGYLVPAEKADALRDWAVGRTGTVAGCRKMRRYIADCFPHIPGRRTGTGLTGTPSRADSLTRSYRQIVPAHRFVRRHRNIT